MVARGDPGPVRAEAEADATVRARAASHGAPIDGRTVPGAMMGTREWAVVPTTPLNPAQPRPPETGAPA